MRNAGFRRIVNVAGFFAVLLSTKISRQKLTIAAILFQALDIYSFRLDLSQLRTTPLTQEEYDISRFQPVPYSRRREPVDYATHYRGKNVPQKNYNSGEIFWTADLLAFVDAPSSSGRTDHWPLPLDDFLRTYSGENIRGSDQSAVFRLGESLKFPFQEPNALKAAGVTEDKIQFFSVGHFVESDEKVSAMMASKEFSGDILLLTGLNGGGVVQREKNDRVERDHRITGYDADNIKVFVKDAKRGDWLYYADCWHPFWSATVNETDVEVYKANLAYKAVQLEPGDNIVHFRFHSPRLAFFTRVLNWNALVWMILPFFFLWRASAVAPEDAYLGSASVRMSGGS